MHDVIKTLFNAETRFPYIENYTQIEADTHEEFLARLCPWK